MSKNFKAQKQKDPDELLIRRGLKLIYLISYLANRRVPQRSYFLVADYWGYLE